MISDAAPMRILAFFVLAALMACTSGETATTVRNVDHEPLYSPGLVRWIAASESGLVIRVTSPDGDARWASRIEEVLAALDWLPFGSRVEGDTGSANTVFHVVAVIDAPVAATADDACAGVIDMEALKPVNGRSHVLMALCHGGRSIGTARAVSASAVSPDSPALADAVRAGAIQAFPLHDPDRDGSVIEPIIVFP